MQWLVSARTETIVRVNALVKGSMINTPKDNVADNENRILSRRLNHSLFLKTYIFLKINLLLISYYHL